MEDVATAVTEAQHGKTTFHIVVNGEPKESDNKKINYEQVVKLAFPAGATGNEVRYSASWTKPDGTEGSLRPGQPPVDVVDGMIFDVRNTYKS